MIDAIHKETMEHHKLILLHPCLQDQLEWLAHDRVSPNSEDCGKLQVNEHRLRDIAKPRVPDNS